MTNRDRARAALEALSHLEAVLLSYDNSNRGYTNNWLREQFATIRADLEAMVRELLAAKERQPQFGWLIENGEQGDELRYRTMEGGMIVWTDDHLKALRFCRREDAERFAEEDEQAWQVVEHGWHAAPTQPASRGREGSDGARRLMDARQRCVEALRTFAAMSERAFPTQPTLDQRATLRALAAAIEGGQEMWQHCNDPEAVHAAEDGDEPHDWINFRRVLVIKLPEE